ncbi:MAG TPA: phosphatidylglycerophosphatase A [Rhodobacteraceae bacterium]|nr:phosphatidylglycerophosphatase A [Paracoccaceae bacterium]
MTLARMIASVGGVGYLSPGPGTWGSLAALPLAWGLHVLGGFPLLLLGIAAVCSSGFWATKRLTEGQADHDPSWIVIDEVAGQWIALLALSFPAWHAGIDIHRLWPGWIAAFVLFRLFDIWKPGPVGWADRKGGPLGVMLDDVIAGVLAGLCVLAMAYVAHEVVMR